MALEQNDKTEAILQTDHLQAGYGSHPVVDGLTLKVLPGKILTLIGPNGSGKSTVLKTIIRQLEPLGGKVVLLGRDMKDLPETEIAKNISIVMTDRMDAERMTCLDIVETGRYPYTGRMGLLSEEDRRIAREALELVHGAELAEVDFDKISDGQRQRILLARAICQEPDVMVLDEPTSFLDIRHKLELLSLLKKMVREKQIAVIVSLHELDLAERISDAVVCVKDGKAQMTSDPEEVFAGNYIRDLYDMERGVYLPQLGVLELETPSGEPKVFVIGGGGSGIATYRRLQRENVAFYAGLLQEQDVEWPVAKALAAEVLTVPSFALPTEALFTQAREKIRQCSRVICTLQQFGPVNEYNQQLLDYAESLGIPVTVTAKKR